MKVLASVRDWGGVIVMMMPYGGGMECGGNNYACFEYVPYRYLPAIPRFSLRLDAFVETVISTFLSSGFLPYPAISSTPLGHWGKISARAFGLSSLPPSQSSHHNSRTPPAASRTADHILLGRDGGKV